MVQVKCIEAIDIEDFENRVNDELTKLENYSILDIKYQSFNIGKINEYSAMITYKFTE